MHWKTVLAIIGCGCVLLVALLAFSRGSKEALRHATVIKDRATVDSLLQLHPSWAKEVIDPNEGTALNIAVETDDEELVRTVLKYPCDLNYAAPSTGTPLQWACYYSHFSVVEQLVNAGADVNAAPKVSNASGTPLQNAASAGRLDVIEFLVKNGADVNGLDPSGQQEPILVLAFRGTPRKSWDDTLNILQYLFDHGVKIPDKSTVGMGGHTVLEKAHTYDAPANVIEFLKNHGVTE